MRNPKNALEILQDQVRIWQYGKNATDLLVTWPVVPCDQHDRAQKQQNAISQDHIYAGILYHLTAEIENPPVLTAQEEKAATMAASNQFEEHFQVKIQAFECTSQQLVPPQLGTFPEYSELPLEKYARVNALLKSLQSALSPSKWTETFVKSKTPYPDTIIHSDNKPTWMRTPDSKDILSRGPAQILDKLKLPRKVLEMHRRTGEGSKSADTLAKHIKDFILYNSFSLPSDVVTIQQDPRVYPMGEMWEGRRSQAAYLCKATRGLFSHYRYNL